MFLATFFAAAVGATGAATPDNPIAFAEKGQLQCYRPDVQKKTCQSIASYRLTGPGTYDNKALIPLAPNATLETHSPVVIKSGAVCGLVRAQELIAGTLRIDGQVVDAAEAKQTLERIANAMTAFTDKEICTTYEPSGRNFTAKFSIGGTYRPDQDETVKWITPGEGYVVTP